MKIVLHLFSGQTWGHFEVTAYGECSFMIDQVFYLMKEALKDIPISYQIILCITV